MNENFQIPYSAGDLANNGLTSNTHRLLNYFWLGFIIYTSDFAITYAFTENYVICQAIQLISFVFLIPSASSLIRFRFENSYLKFIFILYLLWLAFILIKGYPYDFGFIKYMLFNGYFGIFAYLAPLILLFPLDLGFFKKVFTVIVILSIIYLFFDIIFIKKLLTANHDDLVSQGMVESFAKNLSIPAGFLLLTFSYHSPKRRLFAIGILFITILFSILRARRTLIIISLFIIVLSYLLYLYATKGKLLIILLSLCIAFFIANYVTEIMNHGKKSIFGFLIERGDEDTRSGVEEYFYADMNSNEWIVGKGMQGEYFCPNIDPDDLTGYRKMIETDYLNIILKGGVICLALLLLMAVPAIFLGLFYSRNLLSKAAAVWILLWILSLYPANVTTFTLNYLLVWISIGVCYSKVMRNITESDIKEYFRPRI